MRTSTSHWTSLLLLILVVSIPASVWARKPPTPPTDFDERAMTGSTQLEDRITAGMALERLTDEELEAIKDVAMKPGGEKELSRYVAALLGRDQLQAAVNVLQQLSWEDFANEVKAADVLDLLMGQLRWGTCAQAAATRLERRLERSTFLVRALCLQRSGAPEAAMENLEAAHNLDPLEPSYKALIIRLLEERAAGHQLPPAPEEVFRELQRATARQGPVERLFVYHLSGRKDPAWLFGNLEWGGFGASELREVILSRSRSYRYCHAAAKFQGKPRKKALSGAVTVVWRIDALGRVTEPTLVEPNWGGHEQGDWLNACLLDQIEHLRFPRPHYSLPMPARHRFSFTD